MRHVGVRLYWPESESKCDIASRWVHKKSNLMFTFNMDKDQSKNVVFPIAFAQCQLTLKHCNFIHYSGSSFALFKSTEYLLRDQYRVGRVSKQQLHLSTKPFYDPTNHRIQRRHRTR